MVCEDNSVRNLDESHTGFVIERTNLIEQKLMHIISKYLGHQDHKKIFVENVLLNNSLFNLSAKIKAYRHLNDMHSDWPAPNATQFQRLLEIRNAFAHCPANDRDWLIVTSEDGNDVQTIVNQMNQSVSGSGTINRTSRVQVFNEFNSAYDSIDRHLMEILAILTQ